MDSRPPPPFYKTRNARRTRVSARARLVQAHPYSVEVKVCDVSTGGFMAECPDPVRIGSHVSLEVPGLGTVEAQVRWQLGNRMGGQFLDPISLAQCEWTATRADEAA